MTHDPLCPHMPEGSSDRICTKCYEHSCECCQCDLIEKVRADQDRIHREEMQSLVLAARKERP